MKIFRLLLVGVAGFEPAISCSQSRRDNRATLHPAGQVRILPPLLFFFGPATFPPQAGRDNRATLHPGPSAKKTSCGLF